jgi:nucleoside-diphosphate-sugar epimerase
VKALVTGGTGFVGGHVVDRLLEEGIEVRIYSRKSEPPGFLEGKEVEIVRGDLLDISSLVSAMEGIDLFFHIGEVKNTHRTAAERNVKIVRELLDHLHDKGVRRFIFVSSLTVAGIPAELPATEETAADLVLDDHYTAYKRTCEQLIAERCGETEFAVVRLAPVYGSRSRYLRKLMKALERMGPFGFPVIGKGKNLVPLIHVKDAAQAIVLAGRLESVSGETFNLTDGFSHSVSDFLQTIAERLGTSLRLIALPPWSLRFPAGIIDFLALAFGVRARLPDYIDYFSKDILFDPSKAKTLLGWKPIYSDLSTGVAEMVDGYRRQS